MTLRRILTTAAATAVAGAAASVPAGHAADTASALKITGAYAYVDAISAGQQKFVKVGLRTSADLPRRGDGAIQAGGSIAALKGGKVVRKGAKLGRTFTVKFFTRNGQSVTKKLKLRAEREGDHSGKPLGC